MGFYENKIFPWLNDRFSADPEIVRLRKEALAPARGRVIEIGFGTGANLAHYPDAVTEVIAVEPNEGMNLRAMRAIERSRIPVEVILGKAEDLRMGDGSFDTAVSTLVLCTVADPARVLAEIRRVLRPDGQLIVLEHGLS